jgi:hypothetical protein
MREVAAILGVAEGTVRGAVLRGRLEYVVKYQRKLIPRAALDDYIRRTRPNGQKPRGRPKKS